ncbi:MAG: HesA/MoeB/ThiF family protein, partial [Candidatus Aquilonibacter sp.]
MAESPAPARLSLAGRPELRRYSRHLLIPEVGLAGQERLAAARVLVVGAGGLGSPVLQYLSAAGVGRIGIVDDDVVDITNLQRQTIFATSDVGKRKATVAAEHVHAINPSIEIDAIPRRFDTSNAREFVRLYDIVVDCTDRFSTRYLINDACVLEGKPDVYASIFRFDGQVSIFNYSDGPCYRCLYPDAPPAGTVPTCAEGGVLGVLAGLVGTWQANEVLKLVLGIGEPLAGRLLLVESLGARTREVRFERDPQCAVCSERATIFDAVVTEFDEITDESDLAPADLDDALASATLLDVREPHEAVLGLV